jgi:hypothetical protein
MDAINVAGAKIYGVVLSTGYWAALVVGGIAVITALAKKDPQAALKAALAYGTGFAAIYILKWGLDLIRTVFA